MKSIKLNKFLLGLVSLCLFLVSCEKEDEMVVDRVVSPVLVTISGTSFAATEPIKVTTTIYELDKSGILNNAVGIDSIPLSNVSIKVMLNNAPIADLKTDQAGKVTFEKTWSELGLASPRSGNAITLEWAGSHKGQNFLKQGRVQVK